MLMLNFLRKMLFAKKFNECAALIREVAQTVNDERASKCGYDLMLALKTDSVDDYMVAWRRYIKEHKSNEPHNDEQRNGVWVPAIPL